jgi:hypothetical protein
MSQRPVRLDNLTLRHDNVEVVELAQSNVGRRGSPRTLVC